MAGYGSPSTVSHGATASTRSPRVAIEDDLRLVRDRLVEQDVPLAVRGGEHQLVEQAADPHATRAVIGVGRGVGVVLAGRARLAAADDRVVAGAAQLAVVRARLL